MNQYQVHNSQLRLVKASLILLSEDRTTRHAITSRAGTKDCEGCGAKRSFLWCSRCFVEAHR